MDAASIGATGIRAAGNLLSLALSSQWRRGDNGACRRSRTVSHDDFVIGRAGRSRNFLDSVCRSEKIATDTAEREGGAWQQGRRSCRARRGRRLRR